jgi:parvulin-like peptidyl-prolyl isomerase
MHKKIKELGKIIFQVSLLVILFFSFTFSHSHAQDKIIAIINNTVITSKELSDFLSFMRLQLASERQYSPQELDDKLQSIKQDLLEKLIEDKLILQEARKNSVLVEESLIKARMLQIKKRYKSDEEFQRSLAIQGLTEADIEEKIREQALMYNIIEQKVKSQITISPSEITDFYYANIEDFKFPEERDLKYVKTTDKNVAQEIENSVNKGQELTSAAEEHVLEINTLKVSSKEELKIQLKEAVFKLAKGEISKSILIDGYYYLFKLLEITPARQQNLSEVQDTIYRFLFEKKMQEKLTSWLEELKKNSYIHITYS